MDQVLMGQSLCDEALAFAACGWPVFPCSPDDKRPLVGESTPGQGDAGFYRATCAAAEIRAWWQRWPDAMIAAATGAPIGAFVVDLDPKGGVAAGNLLEQLRLRCGGQLPPCPIARTPRGGLHLYYAIPTGIEIGNRTNILGAHKGDAMIDIRGTGGYVILPPSIRRGHKAVNEGCDRAPYSWQENAKFGALPIPEAPAALILLAVSRGREEVKPGILSDRTLTNPSAGEATLVSDRERRYALAAFDDEIRKVQNAGKGMRNNALNNAALKLGSLVASNALSERLVRAGLEHAAEACGLVDDDGWRAVRATIASGLKAGVAQPRDLSAGRDHARFSRNAGLMSLDGYEPPDRDDGDARKVVCLKQGRQHEAIQEIEAIMAEDGPGPIYQRSGELVHIVRRPFRCSDGSEDVQEAIAGVETAAVLCEWTRRIRFERFDARQKKLVPVDPPTKLAEAYFGQSIWRLRNLHHLIATPTLRPDGSLLSRRGYDEATGLYLTNELPGLRVTVQPSKDDALAALETLTELFNAFPYADRDDEVRAGLGLSVALAGLIGAILRPSLPAAPLIGVTAPKAGTGKSYLVDLISMIAIGQRATCVVSGVTPEEFQKTLGASLLASAPLMSLDNMVQPLGGQLLCMVLTQERVDMRMLGFLRMGSLATATAMFATGNNLKIIGDLTRRTLLCQLDAREERPEERTFESDLLAEASRRRPELVSAVLTIARWGYLRRERHPSWSLGDRGEGRPFAGFDAWCLRVRDPLLALGCKDPVGALDRVRAADPLGEQLRILINSWAIEFGDQTVTCKEAVYKANCGGGALLDAMISCAGEQQGEVNKIRLGKFLAAHEGSIVEGMAFHRDEKCKNAVRWRLRPVQGS